MTKWVDKVVFEHVQVVQVCQSLKLRMVQLFQDIDADANGKAAWKLSGSDSLALPPTVCFIVPKQRWRAAQVSFQEWILALLRVRQANQEAACRHGDELWRELTTT